MNINQMAFIICADQAQYYNECVRYINELIVPEAFTTDIICIQEADSMVQGYLAGMQASDAKYKVYLRQDVFILNRNFIQDVLRIFQKDEKIGLIGMTGCSRLPENADVMNCWDVGSMEVFDGRTLEDNFSLRQPQTEYEEVQAVQGTIMITQYDIGWREELLDVLDGWDFYDIALSLDMLRNGYKAAVPKQKTPWCYHIKTWSDIKEYDRLRLKMIQNYPEYFKYQENSGQVLQRTERAEQIRMIRSRMIRLMEAGAYQDVKGLSEEIRLSSLEDTQLREIVNMIEIYTLEEASNICSYHSKWFEFYNWQQMYEYYSWIRLVLIRAAYQKEDERIEELKGKLVSGEISYDAARMIARISLRSTEEADQELLNQKIEEPLVSVILLVYNGQDTIRQTIESVLCQTYANLELIIIDDASKDKSREIISGYKDDRIKVIYLEKNQNVCFAGNVGFENAKGKYVALIGHDDLWRKDKLYKQVAFLEEHSEYGACFTWVDIIDENQQIKNATYSKLYRQLCSDNYGQSIWISRMLDEGNHMCAPSACIRREILMETGYYRYGLVQLQDLDLWLRFLLKAPIYIMQEKLTYYRRFNVDSKNQNLSACSLGNQNRTWHETFWVQYHYLETMSEEKFKQMFQKFMKNSDAYKPKEILCEKAIMLWKWGNCYAVKLFMELLEDEESRKILESSYQIGLNDFYKMNKKSLFFDTGYQDME